MTTRLSKLLLVAAIALIYTLIVFNNLTDYDSNYQFVHHVLAMDSTFPGNHGLWRALSSPTLQTVFYLGIIAWESLTCILLWIATARLFKHHRANAATFNAAKGTAILALTLGALLWFVAFLSIGAEWFLMWQSKTWNGQEAAFRMFTCLVLVLLYLTRADEEL